MYYNARYYDAALGRFISPDAIVPNPGNPQALNRYSYVYNNPLNYLDPSGYCGLKENGEIDWFDCTWEFFANMSIEVRLAWISQFMIQAEASKWFNAIAGALEFFQAEGIGNPGSWIANVDAGILYGINEGYALSEEIISQSDNPAAGGWKLFLDALHRRNDYEQQPLLGEEALMQLWAGGEGASIDYGVERAGGLDAASPKELGLLVFSTGWRLVLSVPHASEIAGGLVGAPLGGNAGFLVCGPLCVGPGTVIGFRIGSEAGETFFDPRSTVGGHSPIYYFGRVYWNIVPG